MAGTGKCMSELQPCFKADTKDENDGEAFSKKRKCPSDNTVTIQSTTQRHRRYESWDSVVMSCIKESGGRRRSRSHDRVLDLSQKLKGSVDVDQIGSKFKFLNRVKQTEELIEIYAAADRCRSRNGSATKRDPYGWKNSKQELRFPVVVSVGGIGKTRFLRDGLQEYFTSPQDFDVRGVKPDFLTRLRRYTYLRLDCSDLDGFGYSEIMTSAAVSLLFEAFKSQLRPSLAVDRNCFRAALFECDEDVYRLELTLETALTIICVNYPDGVIIHVDNASDICCLRNEGKVLTDMMNTLGRALCGGYTLLFAVSGVFHQSMAEALGRDRMVNIGIALPPLQVHHVDEVLAEFFGLPAFCSSSNCYLRYLLWLIGGIPGYLAKLICGANRRCGCDMMATLTYLQQLDAECASDLLGELLATCGSTNPPAAMSWDAICALVSLSVTHNAPWGKRLLDPANKYDVNQAECDQFVYRDSRRCLQLPAIHLHHLYNCSQDVHGVFAPELLVLKTVHAGLTHIDNASLCMAAISHRIGLVGWFGITLERLLNIPVLPERNRAIDVTKMQSSIVSIFDKKITKAAVTHENFEVWFSNNLSTW